MKKNLSKDNQRKSANKIKKIWLLCDINSSFKEIWLGDSRSRHFALQIVFFFAFIFYGEKGDPLIFAPSVDFIS